MRRSAVLRPPTDGLYELGYQWHSMTARRMFRAIVHAAGVALIACGLSILFPILESPADPIDLFFRLGSGVPSALLGLYLLCAAAHAVRFGYPLVRRGERRRLARSSLGPRGAFGLVVRVVGLGLVLEGIRGVWGLALSRFAGLVIAFDIPARWHILSSVMCLAGGVYLLRGAPYLLRFSYPSQANAVGGPLERQEG